MHHFLLLLTALCCLFVVSQFYLNSILRKAVKDEMQTTPEQQKQEKIEEENTKQKQEKITEENEKTTRSQSVAANGQSVKEVEDALRRAEQAIAEESQVKDSINEDESLLDMVTTPSCPSANDPGKKVKCLLGEAFKGVYPRHPPEPWEKQAAEESRISGENLAKMPTQALQRPRFYETPLELLDTIFTGDLQLDPSDVLLDLGGGIGRLCIMALLTGRLKQVIGIELSSSRFAQGVKVLGQLSSMIGASNSHLDVSKAGDSAVLKAHSSSLTWVQGDFLIESWRTATTLVSDSQLFPGATIAGLVRRLAELAPGTLVVSSRIIEGCTPHLLRIGDSKKVGGVGVSKEYFIYAVNIGLGVPPSYEFSMGHVELPQNLRSTAEEMWEQMHPRFRARLSSSTCAAQPEGSLSKIEALARHSQVGLAGNTLDCLFKDLFWSGDGFDMSSHNDLGQAGTYGEITPEGVTSAMNRVGLGEHDVVWDLGAGTGKVCLQVFLSRTWRVRGSIGVELSPSRHQSAAAALVSLKTRLGGEIIRSPDRTAWFPLEQRSPQREVAAVLGDILTVDFSNATVLYIANLLFPGEVDKALRDRLLQLPMGTVFISLKGHNGCLQNAVLLQELILPMTWTREQSVLVYMTTGIPQISLGGVLRPQDAFNDTLMENKIERLVASMHMPDQVDKSSVRMDRLIRLSMDRYPNASRTDAVGTMLYRGFHGVSPSKLECFLEELYWSRPALMFLGENPEEQYLADKGDAYSGFITNMAGAQLLFGDPESAAYLREDDIFVDLGGGQAKLALGVFLATSARRVVSIEQAPSRFFGGIDALRQAVDSLDRSPSHMGPVHFVNKSNSVEVHIDESMKVLEWHLGDMLQNLDGILKNRAKSRLIFYWSNGMFHLEDTMQLLQSLGQFTHEDDLLVTLTPLRDLREVKGAQLRMVEEYSLPLKCSFSCIRNDLPTVYAFTGGSSQSDQN